MANARWCNYTNESVIREIVKSSKGVIQRLNLIPVKSHKCHTFYGYESHMDHGTQKYGTSHKSNNAALRHPKV